LSKKDSEMMKFRNRLEQLSEGNDQRAIANEQIFIKRKIDELNHEINQLENNIGFFSNSKGNNPFIKEVQKNIEKHKEELQTWKDKLKKLNTI
jgi:dynactin complex subunit